MCGIAGYVSLDHEVIDGVVERMTACLHHRGPDAFGYYRDDVAQLGHRRLSIIDLSTGQQPMTSESGNVWVIYNGEIFNHAELRPPLEAAGHRYHSRSDTETILHAYEQYGAAAPTYFRGMFAFALWDRDRQVLFCARDRLGIKPFYYWWDGRVFVFGSEIKALLEHPAVTARLNRDQLAEHLAFGYGNSEETLFAGIRKLMPGHTLTVDVGNRTIDMRQYWTLPVGEGGRRDEGEWIEECRERIETTVRMRLMSDVPLGMFLSGGVDSSLIAAMMKRQVTTPVKTFAVGYRESEYSELSYAREVAAHIGTQHHEVTIGFDDFFEALPKLIWNEDEPIAWPSSVSLYFVSKLASRHVKVVLTGEGSDELFGGYSRYYWFLLNERWMGAWRLLPEPLRRLAREQVRNSAALPAGLRRKLEHTFIGRGEDVESLYLDNFYGAFAAGERAELGFGGDAYSNFRRYWSTGAAGGPLPRMLYADQKTYLVELLMKQDQMSMATSIESRVPFLDHPLVEFAAKVPAHLKLNGKTGKFILKKVAEQYLPPSIVYRRKMGFPTPLRDWLREPRAGAILDRITSPSSCLSEIVDLAAVRPMVDRHRRGELDATDRIWRLLNLELWAQVFLNGRPDPDRVSPLAGAASGV